MQRNDLDKSSNAEKNIRDGFSTKARLRCLEKAMNASNVSGYKFAKDYFELKKTMVSGSSKAGDVTEKILTLNESIKNSSMSNTQKEALYNETGKIYAAIVKPGSLLTQDTKALDILVLNNVTKHPAYEANLSSLEQAQFYINKFNKAFRQNKTNASWFDKIRKAEESVMNSGDLDNVVSIMNGKEDKSRVLPKLSFFSHLNKSEEQITFSVIREMVSDTAKEFNSRNKPVAAEKKSFVRR